MTKDCRSCRLLRATKNPDHNDRYAVCGWVPPAWPSNTLYLEGSALRADTDEYKRWIPKNILVENPTRLKDCPVWEPKND